MVLQNQTKQKTQSKRKQKVNTCYMKSCALLRCGFAEPNETKDTEQEKQEGRYLLYEKLCTP